MFLCCFIDFGQEDKRLAAPDQLRCSMALCAISHAHISRVNVSPARKNAYSNTRSDSFPHAPIPSAAQRCVRPLDVKCRRSWPRFQPKGGRSASPPPPRSSVHGGASVSESFGDFDLVASNNSPAISFPTGSARNASTIVSKVVGAPSKKGSKDVEKTGTGGDGRVLRRTFRSTIMGGKGVRRRWPLRMGDFESPQKAMVRRVWYLRGSLSGKPFAFTFRVTRFLFVTNLGLDYRRTRLFQFSTYFPPVLYCS